MENKKSFLLPAITLALVAVTLVFNFVIMASGSGRTAPVGAPAGGITAAAEDVAVVYGQGRINIKPDIAYITFGVENNKTDPKEAQDANAAQMDKVMAAVKGAGISDADIQTAEYNVYQEYNYSGSTRKVIGYKVTNLIQVTVKEIGKAGSIIKTAYDAGANRFDGIRFDIIARQQAYLDALNMATDRALQKAEFLAKKAGKRIAGVIEIQESSAMSSPYYSPYSNFVSAESAQSAADYAKGTVSSGELIITADVNVKYRLE